MERLSRREGVELYLKGERALNGKSALVRRGPAPPGQHGNGAGRARRSTPPSCARSSGSSATTACASASCAATCARRRAPRGPHGRAPARRCSSAGSTTSSTGSASRRRAPRRASSSRHGHVLVDGRKVDIPVLLAAPRPARRDQGRQPGRARRRRPRSTSGAVPGWIEADVEALAGRVLREPARHGDPDAGRGAADRRVLRAPVTEFARLAAAPCTDHGRSARCSRASSGAPAARGCDGRLEALARGLPPQRRPGEPSCTRSARLLAAASRPRRTGALLLPDVLAAAPGTRAGVAVAGAASRARRPPRRARRQRPAALRSPTSELDGAVRARPAARPGCSTPRLGCDLHWRCAHESATRVLEHVAERAERALDLPPRRRAPPCG